MERTNGAIASDYSIHRAEWISEEWVAKRPLRSSSCKPIIGHINWRLQNYVYTNCVRTECAVRRYIYFANAVPVTITKRLLSLLGLMQTEWMCGTGCRETKSTSNFDPLVLKKQKKKIECNYNHTHKCIVCGAGWSEPLPYWEEPEHWALRHNSICVSALNLLRSCGISSVWSISLRNSMTG